MINTLTVLMSLNQTTLGIKGWCFFYSHAHTYCALNKMLTLVYQHNDKTNMQSKMLSKLRVIFDNVSHPLHEVLVELRSAFSARLIALRCTTGSHSCPWPSAPPSLRMSDSLSQQTGPWTYRSAAITPQIIYYLYFQLCNANFTIQYEALTQLYCICVVLHLCNNSTVQSCNNSFALSQLLYSCIYT